MAVNFVKPKIQVFPDGRVSDADAATYIGLSRKTLANWRSMGKGPPSFRYARKTWYYLADLGEAIKQGAKYDAASNGKTAGKSREV